MPEPRQRVLFLCTGNSARSQMAEGLLRARAGDRYEVLSAGTAPAPQVNPLAVETMRERGIDISAHTPRHIDDFTATDLDLVITVCGGAQESCPHLPGATKTLHIGFDDPAAATGTHEARLAVFRRVADEIEEALAHEFAL